MTDPIVAALARALGSPRLNISTRHQLDHFLAAEGFVLVSTERVNEARARGYREGRLAVWDEIAERVDKEQEVARRIWQETRAALDEEERR